MAPKDAQATDRADGDGYPPEYVESLRAGRIWLVRVLAILAAVTGLLVYGAVFWEWPALLAAFAGTLFLLHTCICVDHLLAKPNIHVVPYFESEVPGVETFSQGQALARNSLYLDELAREAGLSPISEFGFEAPYHNTEVQWHDPEEGLRARSQIT